MAWGSPIGVFGSRERAFRIPAAGGTPVQLPVGIDPRFGAWTTDGDFWSNAFNGGPIQRLSPDGKVTPVLPERTVGLRLEQILEPGPWALVIRAPLGSGTGPLQMFGLTSGEQTTVLDVPMVEAHYTSGFLVYVLPDGVLMAVPFDPKARRTTGAPVQVATGVSLTGNGVAQFAVASNGTVAYIPEDPRSLVLADRAGSQRLATPEGHNYHAPEFSPDGRRFRWTSLRATAAISGCSPWLRARCRGPRSTETGTTRRGARTDSTSRIRRSRREPSASFACGLGVRSRRSRCWCRPAGLHGRWLRDGSSLLTTASDVKPGTGTDIVLIRNGGHGPVEPVIVNQFQTEYPMPSPDGKWFAFVSNQSGEQEVFVRSLDPRSAEVQVSQNGGNEPVWSPDGRELYYRGNVEGRIKMMAAAIRTAPELEVVSRTSSSRWTILSGRRPMPITRSRRMARRSRWYAERRPIGSSCCRTCQSSCDGFGTLRGKKRGPTYCTTTRPVICEG